jgi:hypothetical protein
MQDELIEPSAGIGTLPPVVFNPQPNLAENVSTQPESTEMNQGQLPKSNDPVPGASLESILENEPVINQAQNTQIIISDSSATTYDPTNMSALQV